MRDIVEVLRDEYHKFANEFDTDENEDVYRIFVHRFADENNIKLIGRIVNDYSAWATDGWAGLTAEDEVIFKLKYL